MKWYITRKRLLAIVIVLFLALIAFGMVGCTKREQQMAVKTGGAVSGSLGLPPYVGESLVTLAFSVATYLKGHQSGRKKERACRVAPPVLKADAS